MRVLVTGGLGYLGHAVRFDLVSAGHEVVVLSRRPPTGPTESLGATVAVADLRERTVVWSVIRSGGFDAVVHLAGLARARESFADPLTYFDVNVAGTINVLQAIPAIPAADRPAFVYASTTLVYGSQCGGALDESTAISPESPYAETKATAERIIASHAETGRISATILRIFNVGGGIGGVCDTDNTRIIPNLMRAASGELPYVTISGDGTTVRDFVHVADVASAVRAAIASSTPGPARTFNIGSGMGSRIIDVLRCVETVSGQSVKADHVEAHAASDHVVADISKVRRELGWAPERSTLESIIEDAWGCWEKL